ncbi:SEC14-like protein 2 isoform X1 [Parasteatoda tepidariorum]|uniref:SEC14-like protein 2 isoform X2 n=2 Tax=Parasteatoda tepidariorum TaxID=114398 RepID=UPI00077FD8AB|nr:SEC14-like protein 2 isoform X4 [Parasteatoda tepidariorum]XP_042896746.1 SEC14-like protein 2 isoform X3 [Parasteatoda tepidariorum]
MNGILQKRKTFLKSRSLNYLDMNMVNGKLDYVLQEDQRIKLIEFRKLVADILEPNHDDQFLLRWLKARDFDLSKAQRMFRESHKFRKKIGADTILTPAYEFPDVYKKYPISQYLGFDNENSAVRLFMVGILDYKGYVHSLPVIDLMKILIYFLENDLKMMHERKKSVGIFEEKSTFILDFSGFSLKQFNDKSVINAGIQLITMYQDNYPETLKAAYLINVPSYFSWIFNIFKPFLNAVTLSKIKIYKTDEWQDELWKIVDKDLVPAFLGGNRTDPDGNPKCTTLVNWDSKIDTIYYMKENNNRGGPDPDMKSAVVQQRSSLQVPVDIESKGSILKWAFRTKECNIKFGLFYRKTDKSLEELLPVENVDCQLIPEENEYLCKKTGTYVLYFDNSYSWLTAKQLYYKVEVEAPQIIQTQ